VRRVLTDSEGAVAELRVVAGTEPDCGGAAFWRAREGLLHCGVEYWVDIGVSAPPICRASAADTVAAREAWRR
jgi:hypothetical protein